jgi:DNA polymerase-3 subunit delta'
VSDDTDDDRDAKLPRETNVLFGHEEAERALLDAYKGGRMPHAWLIGGQPGIGKATLAYRLARFVLQGDLLVLTRVINEQTGKLYTVIRVDDVRRTVSFFGSTAGEGGWRIAIVDAVDDLQREGANALLKVLEEPPARTLLLLISHAPGRELPTIRSRCRRLLLRPLDAADVARALAESTGRSIDDPEDSTAAAAADGSVARALQLLDGAALALRQRVLDLFAQLPNPDPRALHALGDALGGTDPQTLATFMDLVNDWLASHLTEATQEKARLARVALAWEKVNRTAREVETYNLERKPFVFSVFGELAEAARV